MQKITTVHSQPIFDVATTRRVERSAAASLPPGTLMQRAGLAVARLALALATHSRCVWVACGPGNIGGDGARFTLSLLTLKPGLFTCEGRDNAGEVSFDNLGVDLTAMEPAAGR